MKHLAPIVILSFASGSRVCDKTSSWSNAHLGSILGRLVVSHRGGCFLSTNLGHDRPTFSDTTEVAIAAPGEDGEDQGDEVGGESEPQEGVGGLGFTAALGAVYRAVGDVVV